MTETGTYFAKAAWARNKRQGYTLEGAATYADAQFGPNRDLRYANASPNNANHWLASKGGDAITFGTQKAFDLVFNGFELMRSDIGLCGYEQWGVMYGSWTRDMAAVLEEIRLSLGITSPTLDGLPVLESFVHAYLCGDDLAYRKDIKRFKLLTGSRVDDVTAYTPESAVVSPSSRGIMSSPWSPTYGAYHRLSTEGYKYLRGLSNQIREGGNTVTHPDFAMALVEAFVPAGKYNAVRWAETKHWPLRCEFHYIEDVDGSIVSCQSHDPFSTKNAVLSVHEKNGVIEAFCPTDWKSFRHDTSGVSEVEIEQSGQYTVTVTSPNTPYRKLYQGQAKRVLQWDAVKNDKGLGLREIHRQGQEPTTVPSPTPPAPFELQLELSAAIRATKDARDAANQAGDTARRDELRDIVKQLIALAA